MEQRPAAMRALDAAQIDGDFLFQLRIDRSRDSAAAARIPPGSWRRPRVRTPNGRRAAAARAARAVAPSMRAERCVRHGALRDVRPRGAGADRALDRRGSPVAVQSPARTRLCQARFGAGALFVLRRRRGEGRPASHDLPRRQFRRRGGASHHARGSSPVLARALEQTIGGADGDRQRPGKAKIHSAVPPITPMISGVSAGGARRKWALTMARNCRRRRF